MKTIIQVCVPLFLFNGVATGTELPQFVVPDHEEAMAALNELHALHHDRGFTDCTLWDAWLPHATIWTDRKKQNQYRRSFLSRRIDAEGYVSMQQHRGMAHSEGWPFPAWQQSTGSGWHFSTLHDVWAIQNFNLQALTDADGWEIVGANVEGIDPARGLRLQATGDTISITTPKFRCGTIVAPFVRLEWAARGLPAGSKPKIAWLLDGESAWQPNRVVAFPPLREADGLQYANIPLYKQPGYAGIVTRYRISIDCAAGSRIDLKSIITAIDTRHPITNALFLRGCSEYFLWTHDIEFLNANIRRMRRALRFALDEFHVQQNKHVRVPWVGHDGRSGLVVAADGTKSLRPGLGVGNNYWDLLPFGGHDAIATMYLCDALRHFAVIEGAIAAHSEWAVPGDESPFDPADLTTLTNTIRDDFRERFWNVERGRFVGWIDLEGRAYDYGFTFVNLEAIHYGLASPEQACSILDWLDGRREVDGDTSRGADIYDRRFAPRATTWRNVETYVWPWHAPESIRWGGQVQDGGAVLGFSYFDLMARLKTLGPDNAWKRLQTILSWFREVQHEGGYRAYYAKPGRGNLQGGGSPGGLGLDQEFLESVLVPQVMLYGFLGFQPTVDGFAMAPMLPKDWPSLSINGIRIHDYVLNVTAEQSGRAYCRVQEIGSEPLTVGIQDRKIVVPVRALESPIEINESWNPESPSDEQGN